MDVFGVTQRRRIDVVERDSKERLASGRREQVTSVKFMHRELALGDTKSMALRHLGNAQQPHAKNEVVEATTRI